MRFIFFMVFLFSFFVFRFVNADELKTPDDFLYVKDEKWYEVLHKVVNVDLRSVNLQEALSYIAKGTGVNICFSFFRDEDMNVDDFEAKEKEIEKKIDLVFDKVRVIDLIWYLCKKYNLSADWCYVTEEQKQNGRPQSIRLIKN